MKWGNGNGLRCPRCGAKATYIVEASGHNGRREVTHIIRCTYCGYREVVQHLIVRREPKAVTIYKLR